MQCLRCPAEELVEGVGVLGEAVCRRCRGRFLTAEATEHLFGVGVGVVDVRLRFDATGLLGHDGDRQTLRSLVEQLDAAVSPAVPRHRGVAVVTRGDAPIDVRSLRDLDREEAWSLWKASSP